MEPAELKEVRARLGFSQEELAIALGMHRLSVLRWEAGLHKIPLMLKLALRQLEREPQPEREHYLFDDSYRRSFCLRGRSYRRHGAGLAEFQSSNMYGTAPVAGAYFLGTEEPGDNTVYNQVGATTVASNGPATATVDVSATTAGIITGRAFDVAFTITPNGTVTGPSTAAHHEWCQNLLYRRRRWRDSCGCTVGSLGEQSHLTNRRLWHPYCEPIAHATAKSRPTWREVISPRRGSV